MIKPCRLHHLVALLTLVIFAFIYWTAAADPTPDSGVPEPVLGSPAFAVEQNSPPPGESSFQQALEADFFLYMPLAFRPEADFLTPFEAQVVTLVNIERSKAGCGPLEANPYLRQAAFLHSKDMGDYLYFSHTGRDGSSFVTRAQRAGYPGSPRGENIAAGYGSPTSVMNGWMNSTGHRNNILNCSSNEIGVGYYAAGQGYGSYWTQVFGRK